VSDIMSTTALPDVQSPVQPLLLPPGERPLYRLTVEQYHEIAACGALNSAPRLELLEGYLVEMTPIGPPHAYSNSSVDSVIAGRLPPGYYLRSQLPITLSTSEPLPDHAVIKGVPRDFRTRHPGPTDTCLIVEVADTSVLTDRIRKATIYAAAEILEYWIVNLPQRQVEVHRDPEPALVPAVYRTRHIYSESDRVPLTIDGQNLGDVNVRDLLP
jgi:Uma2 family endonuclease